MPLTTKIGNLLEATEDFIVQQCNCISLKPHGLSASITKKFPFADSYGIRKGVSGNLAIPKDRNIPGTIAIMGNGQDQRFVINMFAQYSYGKPYSTLNKNKQWQDSYEDRKIWFKNCLEEISKTKPKSLAFPYNIGCGLAGGNWKDYYSILEQFSKDNPNIKIVLYKLTI
jgi:O-acetyl-ADP-ribose deacetylase (regulator of RNase III)